MKFLTTALVLGITSAWCFQSAWSCRNGRNPRVCGKKKCCDGFVCKFAKGKGRKKCVKIQKKYHLRRTIVGRRNFPKSAGLTTETLDEGQKYAKSAGQLSESYVEGGKVGKFAGRDTMSHSPYLGYGDMTMSANGDVLLIPQEYPDFVHVLTDPYDDQNIISRASTKLRPTPDPSGEAYWTTAVSGDGRTVAIQDYSHENYSGIAKVFKLDHDGFWYESFSLIGPNSTLFVDEDRGMSFGAALALNYDGTVFLVGADESGHGEREGFVEMYIYDGTAGEWVSVCAVKGYPGEELGRRALEITDDGTRFAVGGTRNSSAYVFDYISEGNCKEVQKFTGSHENSALGYETIRLSPDGSMLAIGENYANLNGVDKSGAIHVFKWNQDLFKYENISAPILGKFVWSEVGYGFSMTGNGTRLVYADYGYADIDDPYMVFVMEYVEHKMSWKKLQGIKSNFSAYEVVLSRDGNKLALSYPWYSDEDGVENGKVELYEWATE